MRAASRLAALSLLLCGATALAQTDPFARGFDVVPVKPTPLLDSGISLEGGRMLPARSWRAALLFDLNVGVLALKLAQDKLGNLIPFRADAHLLFSYQLLERLELGVDLPITVFQRGAFGRLNELGFPSQDVAAFGLGDLRLVPRIGLLTSQSFPLGLSLIPEVRLPTGDGDSFLGDLGVVLAPRLAAELNVGPVRLIANGGYRLRPVPAQYLNLYVGNEFVSGAGAQLSLPDMGRFRQNKLTGEVVLSTPTEAPFTFSQADSLKTPFELLVGVRSRFGNHWGLELDVGRGLGLQSGYGREDFRVIFGVRYDYHYSDRDGDRIPDEVDNCPDDPEDYDGYQDSDGCPEPDNDADGVLDVDDACPMDPGPKEYDGCPDRDGDQIPDIVDKCPDEPGIPELEGCPETGPEVIIESDRLRVRGNILFETAQAIIQPQSFRMLDEVAKVLTQHPELGEVLVEGHTDNRGGREYNMDLSRRRAKAVVDYLVTRGVAKERLKSAGFGFDRPVASNDTPLGRAKNRRTEFRLVSEAPASKQGPAVPGPASAPAPAPAPSQSQPPSSSSPTSTPGPASGSAPTLKPKPKPAAPSAPDAGR